MREILPSVGIDIGTSTTQVIFSNLVIEDLSSGFTVPRIEIVGKEVVYRGKIHFTPLLSPTEIDMAGVRDIVAEEYRLAGVRKEDLKTGAVVITGETARKQNAAEVLRNLSEFAGDFVVATAGPDLESIIAACGAGADAYSSEHAGLTANCDIGGGTANIAAYEHGKLIATSCLDIGGRLIKVEGGKIAYIADKIAELCRSEGIALRVGDRADAEALKAVTAHMVALLEMAFGLRPKSPFYGRILTVSGKDFDAPGKVKNLCFSGGVADFVYGAGAQGGDVDPFRFGDIGPLLGWAVRDSRPFASVNRFAPKETIRATVVGAGTRVMEISGSTVEFDEAVLPIKNVPILKLSLEEEDGSGRGMADAIRRKLEWFRVEGELQQVAVSMVGPVSPGFLKVTGLAQSVLEGAAPLLALGHPLLVLCENDIAKALGQALRRQMAENGTARNGLVCIDAIRVSHGDYVDIGDPVGLGKVLPVAVKTLFFS